MALMAYQQEHGHLPPTHMADESGRRMHSWRVLLLPHLGYEDLYARYSFDEPWDGPNNRLLWDERVDVYQCPEDPQAKSAGFTSYLAVVGESARWTGPTPCTVVFVSSVRPKRLLIVEVPNSGVRWSQPRDLSADADPRPGIPRDRLLRAGNHFCGSLNQTITVPLGGVAEITESWTMDELDAWIQGDVAKQSYYWNQRTKHLWTSGPKFE